MDRTYQIPLYAQGRSATVSMVMLQRMKKADETIVSEQWENDFADEDTASDLAALPLYARLMYNPNTGVSFINVYRGPSQVLVAPLYFDAQPPSGCVVTIRFRDYSNRQNRITGGITEDRQCLRRLFKFTFASRFEAVVFQVCHNLYLRQMENSSFFERPADDEDHSLSDASIQLQPAACSSPASVPSHIENENEALVDETMVSSATSIINNDQQEEDHDYRRAIFDAPDETAMLDDQFLETQDPYNTSGDY